MRTKKKATVISSKTETRITRKGDWLFVLTNTTTAGAQPPAKHMSLCMQIADPMPIASLLQI